MPTLLVPIQMGFPVSAVPGVVLDPRVHLQQEGTSKYRENILPKKPCNAGPNSKTVNDKMSIQGKTRIATILISGCPGNSFGARHNFVPFLNFAGNLREQGYKKTAHLLQIPVNRELLSERLRNPQS